MDDLYLDESLLRRIERVAKAEREAQEDPSDQEGGEEEEETDVHSRVKPDVESEDDD